ncbi:MAG: hypothetical protein V8R91_02790 [Butyricimonas faecihominis]
MKKVKDVSAKFVDEDLERVLDAVLGKVNLSYPDRTRSYYYCSGRGERGGKRGSHCGERDG